MPQPVDECSEVRFRVRYAETDQMGVVYHANYLVWFEMARTELCRQRGVTYRDIEKTDGIIMIVAEVRSRYHRAAHYDDRIVARGWLKHAHPRMLSFRYQISRENDDASEIVLATGESSHLFLNREGKPIKVPPKYLELFGLE